MRYIYIGFSKPKKTKIGSHAICWWLGTAYSHVYIRFESRDKEVPSTVYHAAHGMVHFIDFNRLKSENVVIKEYVIEISEITRKNILIDAMRLAGLKYAFFQLPKILFYEIFHSIGAKVKFHDNTGYICSELVGKLMVKHLGYQFKKPLFLVNPKDIDLNLKANKQKSIHYIGQ